jgi:putative nucleotidyltransferase with HDIG domain
MSNFETLKQKVAGLYESQSPGRDNWCDWLWQIHVPVVAHNARQLAERLGADAELAEAAAWLHDIADVRMARISDQHEEESLRIGRELMSDAGYSQADIALVIDDAVRLHSCYDGNRPTSKEGQVLATADALAHLKTDFYMYALWAWEKEGPATEVIEGIKQWALKKLERDLNHKICFDAVREETRPDYEQLKLFFTRRPSL